MHTNPEASGAFKRPHISPDKYRPDIDGLRAIAVIPVVLFHAGVAGFQGGYVGVDIFFVVSGYLITSLILPDAVRGSFSLANFYERRIRRIFPALFAVMLTFMVAGLFLIWPQTLKEYAKSAGAATFFFSNVRFMLESGYFARPSDTKLLLHTWSLAVEEQFYIIYPLYLIVITRWFSSALKPLTVITALLSFGLSVFGTAYEPTAAFYLSPTRAWELLLGALLAMGLLRRELSSAVSNVLCLVGLALIAVSILFFSRSTPFPGAYALLPCLGTALVIYGGENRNHPAYRVLSKRALVFTGRISYSLYLWHWPLLVFARLYLMRTLHSLETWTIIAFSLPVAILSWKYIEMPFRNRTIAASRAAAFKFAAGSMAVTAAACLALIVTDGWPGRMPPQAIEIAKVADECARNQNRCNSVAPEDVGPDSLCTLGAKNSAKPNFILWGDSHAETILDAFAQAAAMTGQTGLQATAEGCPPLLGVDRLDAPGIKCAAFNAAILKVAAEPSIREVFMVARWPLWSEGTLYTNESGYDVRLTDKEDLYGGEAANRAVLRHSLKRTLAALQSLNKQTTIVAPIPEVGWHVPAVMAMEIWQGRDIHSEPRFSEFMARNRFVLDLLQELQPVYGFEVIYPHQILCDQLICHVASKNIPLYCDDDHLSLQGSAALIPVISRAL